MDRIVDAFAVVDPVTGDRRFTEGDPTTGTPATRLRGTALNDWQEELVAVATYDGVTLDPSNRRQVLEAIQSVALRLSGSIVGKNVLYNGDFALQQRVRNAGTFAVTPTASYTLDRWRCRSDEAGGNGLATVSRQAFALGQGDVPGAAYFLRWNQTVAANVAVPILEQRVEGVTRFGAGLYTLAVSVKASSAIAGTFAVVQRFGTGGAPSLERTVASGPIAFTTDWTRPTLLVDLGAYGLTSKVLGDNGDDHLAVEIHLPTGATYTVDFADFQFEPGIVASPFARRTTALELALCQRYFERSGAPNLALDVVQAAPFSAIQGQFFTGGGAGTSEPAGFTCRPLARTFRVPKRRRPTMRWWDPETGAQGIQWGEIYLGAAGNRLIDTAAAGSDAGTFNACQLSTGFPVCVSGPPAGVRTWFSANFEADAEL